jgi:adenine-specific DNA-methyltransferase
VEDFEEEVSRVQRLLYEVIKPGGSLCWQVGSHVQSNIVIPLDYIIYKVCAEYPDLYLRNRVVWAFEHGINSTRRLSGRYETVLWFTRGTDYIFNLDAIRIPQKYPGKRSYKGHNRGHLSGNPLGKNPGDVWLIPNVKANHVEKTGHPCQFPVALVSRFIKATTRPGGLILDPFAGSGSTAVAALEAGRPFHCIEMDEAYAQIAADRIQGWYAGHRPIRADTPPAEPDPRSSVARRPDHFWTKEEA